MTEILEKIKPYVYLLSENSLVNRDAIEGENGEFNRITNDDILVWHNPETGNFGYIYTFEKDNLNIGDTIG